MTISDQLIRPGNIENDLGDMIAAIDRSHFERHFSVSFQSGHQYFQVLSSDKSYVDAVELAHTPSSEHTPPHAKISVRLKQDLRIWPRWSSRFFRERDVEAEIRNSRYRLHYFDECDFWQIYDRETSRGYQLMPHSLGFPKWDPGSPLRNFVHWRLLEDKSSLIHSGTLGIGGRGIILAGAGGSGKSATVLSGILRGLDSVGDDYVALRQGDHVTASKAFEIVKLNPTRLATLGVKAPDEQDLNWQGKFLLTLEKLAERAMPEMMHINAICLPFVSGQAHTRITDATPRDAFLALAPSGVSQIPSARAEMFTFAASLSRKLPAFHVGLGTDPDELVGILRTFIEGLS